MPRPRWSWPWRATPAAIERTGKLPFLRAPGLDPRELFAQLFSTPAGGFFGMDIIVSSVVLWVFVLVDGRRAGVRNLWAPIAANLAVGVSLGLPLFLYMRERRLETRRPI